MLDLKNVKQFGYSKYLYYLCGNKFKNYIMIGKKVLFETEVPTEPYKEAGQYKTSKTVELTGVILDKYRGNPFKHVSWENSMYNLKSLDFYLIQTEDGNLTSVRPNHILKTL